MYNKDTGKSNIIKEQKSHVSPPDFEFSQNSRGFPWGFPILLTKINRLCSSLKSCKEVNALNKGRFRGMMDT